MTNQFVKSWIVPLTGNELYLEKLSKYLESSPITLTKRGNIFYLQISSIYFQNSHLDDTAAECLALINGAAILLTSDHRTIKIEGSSFIGIDENGNAIKTVILGTPAELRINTFHGSIVINGITQPDTTKELMNNFLNQALQNKAKADALVLIGRASPSWSELNLVYELVHSNNHSVYQNWIDENNEDLFTHTANNYTALGREARHSKKEWVPPPQPMEHHVAVSLMRSLVMSWLKSEYELK